MENSMPQNYISRIQAKYDWINQMMTYPFPRRIVFRISELKDPIWHSSEWQIGSFSSEATIWCLKMVHALKELKYL